MTETVSFESLNALKRTHAEAIIASISGLRDVIASEPELWFGGLPPVLTQLDHLLSSQAERIAQVFDIGDEPE